MDRRRDGQPLPPADAAAMPACALTAWQALFEHAGLEAGQTILINGAGGGVAELAAKVDAGQLRIDVADRRPLAELAGVHRQAEQGVLPGKIVIVP